jgi:NAD/NADP transhydrogenase alpha subunit
MRIGVPLEIRPGETRVAATPETVKKLIGQGHTVVIQKDAGVRASQPDSAYEAVGTSIGSAADAFGAEIVLKVRAPEAAELKQIQSGSVLIGMLDPFDNDNIAAMAAILSLSNGSSMPRSTLPDLICLSSADSGARTLRTISAPKASAALPMEAPTAS